MDYFVNFGRSGFLGRFCFHDADLHRGDRVIVSSCRGLEIGSVLERATDSSAAGHSDGDVLRLADEEDLAAEATAATLAADMIVRAEHKCTESSLPIVILDAEALLDKSRIIISVLGGTDDQLSTLRDSLGDVSIEFHRPDQPAEEGGCGKPGCGSKEGGCSSCGTSGGCSSGGCSRGSAKSASDMTAYFADLRRTMHDQLARVSLH